MSWTCTIYVQLNPVNLATFIFMNTYVPVGEIVNFYES